jgi:hypothetical protein
VALLHIARVLSVLLLPADTHRRLWNRKLCGWVMHDEEVTCELGSMFFHCTCRNCGRKRAIPVL